MASQTRYRVHALQVVQRPPLVRPFRLLPSAASPTLDSHQGALLSSHTRELLFVDFRFVCYHTHSIHDDFTSDDSTPILYRNPTRHTTASKCRPCETTSTSRRYWSNRDRTKTCPTSWSRLRYPPMDALILNLPSGTTTMRPDSLSALPHTQSAPDSALLLQKTVTSRDLGKCKKKESALIPGEKYGSENPNRASLRNCSGAD